jgi:hypothetical protein
LENETRQKCDDFLGFVRSERVVEDELSQDELVRRVDLEPQVRIRRENQ